MNSRTIQIMAVVAIGVAGAAWFSTRSQETTSAAPTTSGAELFPQLSKKTGDVHTIKVQSKGQSFTIEKQGDGWGLVDKGGYAVHFDKVKDLVSKLAYFKILEKKTDSQELLAKLDLDEPDKPESKSTRVTLSDSAGSVLADVVIGKSASGGGPTISSMYVRRPGENQAFEVSGTVYVDGSANNWLDKQVVKLERARVHKVETVQADGSKLVLSKTSPDDKNFTVQDLPAGAELKWPGVGDGIAGALEYLNFDDVQAAGSVDFGDPATTTTTMQTFDGMLLTVKVLEKEGKFYSQFSAHADPSARVEVSKFEVPPAGPEAPKPPADPGAAPTADPAAPPTPPQPPQPVETKSVPGKSAEDVAKEATELEARLSKWTYVLPGYAASNFSKKMSDMLKEATPPAPPPADPNAPPADPIPPPVDKGEAAGGELKKPGDGR